MLLIDRLIAPLAARSLVKDRPGMGWLLTEMAPVVAWTGITGAMGLESILLVSYLTLLGCSDQMLALLPMLGFGGMLIALAVIHVQRRLHLGNAQRHAFRAALLGRSLWMGIVVWPLLAWALDLPAWCVWGGVLLVIAIAQTVLWTGVSSFATWTQAVVPLRLRGHFFAWRNTVSFGVLALTMSLVGYLLPAGGQGSDPAATLDVLMWMFAITTVIAVLASWPLLWSPQVPTQAIANEPKVRLPLRQVLREQLALRRMLWYGFLSAGANAIFLTYMARYLVDIAVGEDAVTLWQGLAQMPCMLIGIWLSGWLLPRLGGGLMLGLSTVALMLTQGLFLFLSGDNTWWMLPLVMALWGLTRASQRLVAFGRMQEVMSAGDARQPSLYFGMMGLGAILGSATVMIVVPHLNEMVAQGHLANPVSWYVMTGAVVVGAGAALVAALPQPPHQPYDPEAGIIPSPQGLQGTRP